MEQVKDEQGGMSEEEKRARVVELAFGGDRKRFDELCEVVRQAVPEATAVVLRGRSITGARWCEGAPFGADGPGTSDLDLTLVGEGVLGYYIIDGFYLPGVHTRSEERRVGKEWRSRWSPHH